MKHLRALLIISFFCTSLPTYAQNATAVFAKVSPSVVVVKGKRVQGSGVAVGVVTVGFNKQTTIVTNCHVVSGETLITISHQNKEGFALVESCDSERDLAILKLTGELPLVVTRSAASLAVGEPVFAVGAPKGLALSISQGIISQLRSDGIADRLTPMIQTTAAISPGSSGGGLFDAQGRLIGVTTLYLKDAQSLNFAIPSDWIAQAPSRNTAKSSPKTEVAQAAPKEIVTSGWVKVTESDDGAIYSVDYSTIKQHGRYRFMWELRDYKIAKQFQNKSYHSVKLRFAFDCSAERRAGVSYISHRDLSGTGEIINSSSVPESEWKFTDLAPGTVGELMLQTACKN